MTEAQTAPKRQFDRTALWVTVAAFVFVGFLVYAHSLAHQFVRWDDGLLIYENPAIRGINFQNLKTIFTTYDPELYIPLTLLSYQVDFLIAGTKAGFYHFHSLVLHILNALLTVWFVSKLMRNKWIAIVVGLAFLLHPLNTEAIAWASGRKDLLSTAFFLLTLIFYESYRETDQKKWYIGSIVAFLFGLLAKVTVITAPAIIVLICFLQKRPLHKKLIRDLVPYGVLMVMFAVIAYYGKTGVLDSSSRIEKLLIAPMSTMFYIQKLIFPTGLSVIYPFTGAVELLSLRIFVPIVLCALLLILGLNSLKKTRLVFFGLAFFVLTLSPSLLNFSKGDFLYFASDRYAYISSIGILLLFSTGAWKLRQKYGQAIDIAVGVLLLCSAIAAYRQASVWKNSETLFTHVITQYPEAHSAHNNLGNIYRTQGRLNDAIASYEESLRLSEEFGRGTPALYGRSKILSNLASAYRESGDVSGATDALTQAQELNPLNSHAFMQEGIILGMQNRVNEAEQAYRKAIDLDPAFTTAKVNLGSLLINIGRPEEAIEILEDAIEWNPYYPHAYYNLAAAYRAVGRQREAFDTYIKAVDLEPAFVAARINLGILYAERKKIDEAIEQFRAVLQYDPDNQRALSALRQLGVQ